MINMSSNNSFSFLILFSLFLLLILDSSNLTVAKSCLRKCGGIKIPYPFGIGKGCYLEKWYEINCVYANNTSVSKKLVPFLSIINKEVVSISLPLPYPESFLGIIPMPQGSVRVKNRVTSQGCSSHGEELGSLLNLTGTPFYVGDSNTLIAVGCNNTVSLTNVEPSMVGCTLSCGKSEYTLSKDYFTSLKCSNQDESYIGSSYRNCNQRNILDDEICKGFGCCQANMPDQIQQIVGVKIDNTTTTGGCKVALLTDKIGFVLNGYDPMKLHAKGYGTVELGWFIHTTNHSFVDSLGCRVNKDTKQEYAERNCICDYSAYLSYARCSCATGYEGNPYIQTRP